MYEIILSDKAKRQLQKLSKEIRDRIGSAIERIKIRPEAYVKRLVGVPYYSLRVGDYRVILNIQQNKLIIFVIEIGHRKNVYRSI